MYDLEAVYNDHYPNGPVHTIASWAYRYTVLYQMVSAFYSFDL